MKPCDDQALINFVRLQLAMIQGLESATAVNFSYEVHFFFVFEFSSLDSENTVFIWL